jgi:two-component system LytT family response regulator
MELLESDALSSLRVAIIEDQAEIRKSLKLYFRYQHPSAVVLGEAESVQGGIEILSSTAPDLLFLDIQIKNGKGFDVLDALPNYHERFATVIMTAYENYDYAIHAHNYDIQGYLRKPFTNEQIEKVLVRVHQKLNLLRRAQVLVPAVEGDAEGNLTAKLTLRLREGGLQVMETDEVAVCAAHKGYVRITLADGSSLLVLNTLEECEASLKAVGGMEIERGTLINPNFCTGWEENGRNAIALMESGQRLNVSRRMKSSFVALMKRRFGV